LQAFPIFCQLVKLEKENGGDGNKERPIWVVSRCFFGLPYNYVVGMVVSDWIGAILRQAT